MLWVNPWRCPGFRNQGLSAVPLSVVLARVDIVPAAVAASIAVSVAVSLARLVALM